MSASRLLSVLLAGALWIALATGSGVVIPKTSFQSVIDSSSSGFELPYTLDAPEAVFSLPTELREISGLTALDSNHVAAIQDEKGMVYVLNVESGLVEKSVRFAGNGDYEGIEKVGNDLFVLRSDGDLFRLSAQYQDWNKRESSERIRTILSRRYDTEGLAIYATSDALLIVCKEYAGKGFKRSRAIYTYDLTSQTVRDSPMFVISSDSVNARFTDERISHSRFKPSAVAVHPDSGHIYVLSSPNRLLIVSDTLGNVLTVKKMKRAIGRQPEGIAFLVDGSMILASEAAGAKARLARFKMRSD